MASEMQIAANRLNAIKSTGPKTANGKERVGRNAVKYGLHARKHFLLPENESEYGRLKADLLDQKNPKGATEEDIVEQLARNSMLLAQCDRAHDARLFELAKLSAAHRVYQVEAVGVSAGSNLHMFEGIKKQMLLDCAKEIELTEEDCENALTMMFADPEAKATALINRTRQSCYMNIKHLEERLTLLQEQRSQREETEKDRQERKECDEHMSQFPPLRRRRPVAVPSG